MGKRRKSIAAGPRSRRPSARPAGATRLVPALARPAFLLTLPGVPRRAISRAAGRLARLPLPAPLRRPVLSLVARRLGIPREEVPGTWPDYASVLELFTRPLPPGSRPLPGGAAWLSPADGTLLEEAALRPEGSWLVKGTPYTTEELLPGHDPRALADYRAFQIYLSPRDYHRFHAPCALQVEAATSCPGDLLPVDPAVVRRSHRVLARNRRILLDCRDAEGRWFGLLCVGALNVGRMRFVFDPTLGVEPLVAGRRRYDPPVALSPGAELGRFELGSTILLFAPPGLRPLLRRGDRCRAREPLLLPGSEEAER